MSRRNFIFQLMLILYGTDDPMPCGVRRCHRTICRGFTMKRENIAIPVACAVAVLAILACLFITQGDRQPDLVT